MNEEKYILNNIAKELEKTIGQLIGTSLSLSQISQLQAKVRHEVLIYLDSISENKASSLIDVVFDEHTDVTAGYLSISFYNQITGEIIKSVEEIKELLRL